MPPESIFSPADQEQFETLRLRDAIPFLGEIKKVSKFFTTRRAVMDGVPLYNLPQKELSAQGLLGPLSFNAIQSSLCSIGGMALSIVIRVLSFEAPGAVPEPLQDKVMGILKPIAAPFALLAIVYLIAYGCLPIGYCNKANWRAAQRKYLYLDGAHGFWPQLLLSLCLAVSFAPAVVNSSAFVGLLVLAATIAFYVVCVWQAILTYGTIKSGLFDFDFLDARPTMFEIFGAVGRQILCHGDIRRSLVGPFDLPGC